MKFVIGSGPAGVSCAAALLERGCEVTLLDVGVELDSEKKKILDELKIPWAAQDVSSLKHKLDSKNPLKFVYNSDFPYADVKKHIFFSQDKGTECIPSFAKGGLSNAWGAFVECYDAENFANWPFGVENLTPYYQKILQFLSPAMACENPQPGKNYYYPSRQAKKIFSHLESNRLELKKNGFVFDYATLAAALSINEVSKCQYCGLCQHGCPASLIYSAKQTLMKLEQNPKFIYKNNVVVDCFEETADSILISAHGKNDNQKITFEGTQVFCACGPVISSILFLRSAKLFDKKITLKDSTHFMVPCFMYKRVKHVTREKLNTLCQLSLRLSNKSIAPQPINLQIYTYMDHYTQQFKNLFKFAYKPISFFIRPLLDRLVIIQGYLDSEDSHKVAMTVSSDGSAVLTSDINSEVKSSIKKLLALMKKKSHLLGIYPILSMLKISKIGKSFHYGASLPMRISPTALETDIFGRPFQFKRLHIVDASVFPTIPAASITPTIMANAYRIGSESPLL